MMGKARVFGEISPDKPFRKSIKKEKKDKEKISMNKNSSELEPVIEEEKYEKVYEENEDIYSKLNAEKNPFQKEVEEEVKDKSKHKYENLKDDSDSLKSVMKMVEDFFGDGKKGKEVQNKIEKIVDNFSNADKSSLWETYVETEKEISPFGEHYLPDNDHSYDKYGEESAKTSCMGISLFLILVVLLYFND